MAGVAFFGSLGDSWTCTWTRWPNLLDGRNESRTTIINSLLITPVPHSKMNKNRFKVVPLGTKLFLCVIVIQPEVWFEVTDNVVTYRSFFPFLLPFKHLSSGLNSSRMKSQQWPCRGPPLPAFTPHSRLGKQSTCECLQVGGPGFQAWSWGAAAVVRDAPPVLIINCSFRTFRLVIFVLVRVQSSQSQDSRDCSASCQDKNLYNFKKEKVKVF